MWNTLSRRAELSAGSIAEGDGGRGTHGGGFARGVPALLRRFGVEEFDGSVAVALVDGVGGGEYALSGADAPVLGNVDFHVRQPFAEATVTM